jgi:hypothetical protein
LIIASKPSQVGRGNIDELSIAGTQSNVRTFTDELTCNRLPKPLTRAGHDCHKSI